MKKHLAANRLADSKLETARCRARAAALALPLLLTACAGGGAVGIPDTVVPVPTLSAFNPAAPEVVEKLPDAMQSFNTGEKASGVEYWKINTTRNGFTFPSDRLVYRAPDGRLYNFGTFTNPLIPGFGDPDKNLKTSHDTQPTDNGGKLFVCCDNGSRSYAPTKSSTMAYGIWFDTSGKPDLFVGGVAADPQKMQGATADNNYQATGKATYEVWALRAKNGAVVSSTYKPNSSWREKDGIKSLVTVNFNTGKLGGKIIGNADFGADIDFAEVNVEGNRFSGSAVSDGQNGRVEGGFFGKAAYRTVPGHEIGGTIVFEGNRKLDSVFGGSVDGRSNWNKNDESQDLTPLQ